MILLNALTCPLDDASEVLDGLPLSDHSQSSQQLSSDPVQSTSSYALTEREEKSTTGADSRAIEPLTFNASLSNKLAFKSLRSSRSLLRTSFDSFSSSFLKSLDNWPTGRDPRRGKGSEISVPYFQGKWACVEEIKAGQYLFETHDCVVLCTRSHSPHKHRPDPSRHKNCHHRHPRATKSTQNPTAGNSATLDSTPNHHTTPVKKQVVSLSYSFSNPCVAHRSFDVFVRNKTCNLSHTCEPKSQVVVDKADATSQGRVKDEIPTSVICFLNCYRS